MNHTDRAVSLFKKGYNCSQAILAAWGEEFGLPEEKSLKLACGLGGGIGCMGGMCGALTGAVLVLGLRYGTADPMDKSARYELYRRTQDLAADFKIQAGSMYCRDLLGFDMSTTEGQEASRKTGAFDECPDFVRIAAKLVQETLDSTEMNT